MNDSMIFDNASPERGQNTTNSAAMAEKSSKDVQVLAELETGKNTESITMLN